MILLPLILAGHFIGDWIVQTDWQAANKAKNWLACLQHVTSYSIALGLCTLPAVWLHHSISLSNWTILIVVSFATHAFIDRRWPVRKLMELTRSSVFAEQMWGVIATDQALHLSILCILAAVLVR